MVEEKQFLSCCSSRSGMSSASTRPGSLSCILRVVCASRLSVGISLYMRKIWIVNEQAMNKRWSLWPQVSDRNLGWSSSRASVSFGVSELELAAVACLKLLDSFRQAESSHAVFAHLKNWDFYLKNEITASNIKYDSILLTN